MRPTAHCSAIFLFAILLASCWCAELVKQGSRSYCDIPCEKERFDLGKDCVEASGNKCECVAHCCWAFDCRLWPVFALCRKKCRVVEWNRFGPNKGHAQCNHFRCQGHFIMKWDLRDVEDEGHRNCIQHCCYAFNCKKYSGYCREMCIR